MIKNVEAADVSWIRCIKAVSYTHLFALSACNADVVQIDDYEWKMRTVMSNDTAVSYTHLDVYKRQEQGKSIIDAEMFFHPSIYILSVIFSAITVWIACNAPAKAAAKISPVEALKFQTSHLKKRKAEIPPTAVSCT